MFILQRNISSASVSFAVAWKSVLLCDPVHVCVCVTTLCGFIDGRALKLIIYVALCEDEMVKRQERLMLCNVL